MKFKEVVTELVMVREESKTVHKEKSEKATEFEETKQEMRVKIQEQEQIILDNQERKLFRDLNRKNGEVRELHKLIVNQKEELKILQEERAERTEKFAAGFMALKKLITLIKKYAPHLMDQMEFLEEIESTDTLGK